MRPRTSAKRSSGRQSTVAMEEPEMTTEELAEIVYRFMASTIGRTNMGYDETYDHMKAFRELEAFLYPKEGRA